VTDPNVLVGAETRDDAGVYRLTGDLALVQTVDFFTPIVDDAYDYGAIAAANALSDIYAMGAKPLFALAIGAFPESLDAAIVNRILLGGAQTAASAGVSIIGGHTIKDDEPKYGLAVTGTVEPSRMIRNDTAEAGDALVLTKPLGTGILTTARRADAIDDATLAPAVESMKKLNAEAAEAMRDFEVHAATDVTGFGFLGHLDEMLARGIGAHIEARAIPLFPQVAELAQRDVVPGGSRTNLQTALRRGVIFKPGVPEYMQIVLADAQTSGGLLVALRPVDADSFAAKLRATGHDAAIIGHITAGSGISVE